MNNTRDLPLDGLPCLHASSGSSFAENSATQYRSRALGQRTELLLDMHETERALCIEALLPEIRIEEVVVEVINHVLIVRSEWETLGYSPSAADAEQPAVRYSFRTSILLPERADVGKMEAVLNGSVLNITIPWHKPAMPQSS